MGRRQNQPEKASVAPYIYTARWGFAAIFIKPNPQKHATRFFMPYSSPDE